MLGAEAVLRYSSCTSKVMLPLRNAENNIQEKLEELYQETTTGIKF
jgi:hypothetical protein